MSDYCKNCGLKNLEPIYEAQAFDSKIRRGRRRIFGLARCSDCQLVNTTDLTLNEVAEAYTVEYYGSANKKFVGLIERGIELGNILRAKKILKTWRRRGPTHKPPSVLDIGCGRGQLLNAFRSLGSSVLGLEREEFPVDHISRDFVRTGSIGDREYAHKKFDIVILWHVLEHMEKHDALLGEIASHMNDSGLLVIAVPNFSSFQQKIFSKHWFHLDLPRHLVHFDSQWLAQRLKAHGFSVEKKGYLDLLQNIFGFTQSAMNSLAPGKMNEYYGLLKHGQYRNIQSFIHLIGWSLVAVILLPFAIFDTIFGAILNRGATVELAARTTRTP